MINFISAIAAGASIPYIQNFVGEHIINRLTPHMPVGEGEKHTLAFIAALIVASLVIAAVGGSGSAFGLIFGGLIGLFGMRIIAIVRGLIDGKKKDAVEEAVESSDDS